MKTVDVNSGIISVVKEGTFETTVNLYSILKDETFNNNRISYHILSDMDVKISIELGNYTELPSNIFTDVFEGKSIWSHYCTIHVFAGEQYLLDMDTSNIPLSKFIKFTITNNHNQKDAHVYIRGVYR